MPVRVRVSPSAPSLEYLIMNSVSVECSGEGWLQSLNLPNEELLPVTSCYCCVDALYCLIALITAENLLLSIYSAFFSKLEGSF